LGYLEFTSLTLVTDRYDGQSNIIATNTGKNLVNSFWFRVNPSSLKLAVTPGTPDNPEPLNP
jgi:hypothetical protein